MLTPGFINAQQAAYRRFCADHSTQLPVFAQSWYLDSVCEGGFWGAAMAEYDGKTGAVWPYFLKQKLGWKYVAMPVLGKFHGPYFLPFCQKPDTQIRLTERLWSQMPLGLAAFEQDFHYSYTNWLPLYWQGFRQTTRYSYTIPLAGRTSDEVWQAVSTNYRRKIERAQQHLQVRHDLPLADLYRVATLSFQRQQLPVPFSFEFFQRLHLALAEHGQSQCFFVTDPQTGAIHSVAYLIWDAQSAYYLLAGDDPAFRSSGSGVLAAWAAIRYTKEVLNLPVFDFEGSMIRAIEQGRREFGAQALPYFRLQHEWSPLWRWGKWLLR